MTFADAMPGTGRAQPWYESTHRWGMTNLSERDVADYDIGFWTQYWRDTRIQGLVANGVAKFATFPSTNPFVPTSRFAPDRDLLGEMAEQAHDMGLVLGVRMDSRVVPEPVLEHYEQWRVRTPDGILLPQMCLNSPYRREVVFGLFQEVIDRYRPQGFTDNGAIGTASLCHCSFCEQKWSREIGGPMPRQEDLDDPLFRTWWRWNQANLMANWDDTQAFLTAAGGDDCLFLGLARKFSPLNRTLATRVKMMMMDCQSRNDSGSFPEHVDEGRYMHGILGREKSIAICSSLTHHSHGYFRMTSDPDPEIRMYLLSGIAGGFAPWWHHPTGYSPDRRAYGIAESIFTWHEENIDVLTDRDPVAQVAVLRSDDADQYFGRETFPFYQPDWLGEVTQAAYRGAATMLFDAKVPLLPVNIDDLDDVPHRPQVLFLANLGGLSDAECERVRAFVRAGGGLIATGHTSLFDEDGEPRAEFALADVLGVSLTQPVGSRHDLIDAVGTSMIRTVTLDGTGLTDELSRYGGGTVAVEVAPDRDIVARVAPGDEPAAILGQYGAGRVAYLPVDIDRRYLHSPQPAHADLIGNLVDWCSPQRRALSWESEGRVGAYLYAQRDGRILHLLNFSGDNGGSMMEGSVPSGEVTVRVEGFPPGEVRARSRVRDDERTLAVVDGAVTWAVDSFDEHDVWELRPITAGSAA